METNRGQFLILGTLVQGVVTILALVLAWLLQINPFDRFHWSAQAVVLGIVSTIPMLALFVWTWRLPYQAFKDIKEFLIEGLGPFLADCRWYDLVWVALLAGYSEELMFRGVLQTTFSHWGLLTGLLVSNLIFSLAHAVTRMYVLLAALLGLYLGILFQFAESGNLLIPMLTHAIYDLVAFHIVRRVYLSRHKHILPDPSSTQNAVPVVKD